MHRQRGDAAVFGGAGDVQCIAVLPTPAGADILRHWHHGSDGLDDLSPLFLNLLSHLPEEQIRADGGSEDDYSVAHLRRRIALPPGNWTVVNALRLLAGHRTSEVAEFFRDRLTLFTRKLHWQP